MPETLFAKPPPKLKPRQQFALDVVKDSDGISAEELGALLCDYAGRHASVDRCRFCRNTGQQMLVSLRSEKNGRRVVRTKEDGLWRLRGARPSKRSEEGTDPATMDIPF